MDNEEVTIKGIGASPGTAIGFVRLCEEPSDVAEKFEGDDILVTAMTDPKWTVYMKMAKAIVTNSGGVLCHAAIVARELNIPCVVGTLNATEVLKDGMRIKVDGLTGLIANLERK